MKNYVSVLAMFLLLLFVVFMLGWVLVTFPISGLFIAAALAICASISKANRD